jgi:hypothetical protein
MINLLNYETFFLLYADGELSPSEEESVLKFVEQHPLLEEEFNRINSLTFTPDKGLVMMDKSMLRIQTPEEIEADYSFEPDPSIVYPNKAGLYRKENVLSVYWLRMVGVAAAIFFTLGIAWMVMGEKENIPAIVKASRGATSPSSTETVDMSSPTIISPSSENKIVPSITNLSQQAVAVEKIPLAKTGFSINIIGTENPEGQVTIDLLQTSVINTPQVVVPDLPAVSSPQQVSVQQKRNLSEAVLLAAAERMASTAAPMASEPTTMFINAAMKEEKKSGFRTILRTINRRLLNEQELPEDQKFIQVANFYIPVNK